MTWADSSSVTDPMDHHQQHHHVVLSNNPNSNNSNTGNNGSIIEDQRALRLALELSMLGLSTSDNLNLGSPSHNSSHLINSGRMGSPLSPSSFFLNGGSGILDNPSSPSSLLNSNGHNGLCHHSSILTSSSLEESFRTAFSGAFLPRKSQNMTECVPVPSSEHVAEIVGRQGCKIKALRAKTNTYIKTPVRGEEPVFVVTGRKEDVAMAKREILSAADHFTQIRASRKGGSNGLGSPGGSLSPTCPPNGVPGQITIQVRVPYRVVGLVVGPKGATIKRIQQQTHTYIVTPSRDKDPVFEVTGLPDSVQMAKREIEAHIAIRTGSLPLDTNGIGDDLTSSELLANLYKSGFHGLDQLGLGFGLGLGLGGAINSLSSSLSSVSGLGLGAIESNDAGETVGSSSSGGGSLSSLSSLNGLNGNVPKDGTVGTEGNNMFSSIFDYPGFLSVPGLTLGNMESTENTGKTVGSSSSGGGSLSSLSSLNGFNGNGGLKDGSMTDGNGTSSLFSPYFDYPSD